MLRPIVCAASSKPERMGGHLDGQSVNSMASSAKSWSVNLEEPTVIPMVSVHLARIQSMTIQKRAGANTQPWRTLEVDSNGSDSCPPILIRDVVPACRSSISWIRNGGAPCDRRAFHKAASVWPVAIKEKPVLEARRSLVLGQSVAELCCH